MTRSAWKLTYDPAGTPLVLLDYGDRLRAEPTWDGRRGYEVAELVRAAAPSLHDRGNRTVEIAFERFVTAATDAASREAMMAGLISLLALAPKPLRVEVQGIAGKYWQFGNAMITSYAPLRHIPGATPRAATSLALTCTGLALVTV